MLTRAADAGYRVANSNARNPIPPGEAYTLRLTLVHGADPERFFVTLLNYATEEAPHENTATRYLRVNLIGGAGAPEAQSLLTELSPQALTTQTISAALIAHGYRISPPYPVERDEGYVIPATYVTARKGRGQVFVMMRDYTHPGMLAQRVGGQRALFVRADSNQPAPAEALIRILVNEQTP